MYFDGGGCDGGDGGQLSLAGCNVTANAARTGDGGGVTVSGGGLLLESSAVAGNRAAGDGGGLALSGYPGGGDGGGWHILRSVVWGNAAGGAGAGVAARGGACGAREVAAGQGVPYGLRGAAPVVTGGAEPAASHTLAVLCRGGGGLDDLSGLALPVDLSAGDGGRGGAAVGGAETEFQAPAAGIRGTVALLVAVVATPEGRSVALVYLQASPLLSPPPPP